MPVMGKTPAALRAYIDGEDPITGKPEKCDFCYDRLQQGEEPVCAKSCMGRAIIFGDINDIAESMMKRRERRRIGRINR